MHKRKKPVFIIYCALVLACGGESTLVPHVRILYPLGGKGDRTFCDRVYEGLVKASLEVNFSKTEFTPEDPQHAETVFKSWIDATTQDPELIITVGQSYTAFINKMACAFNGKAVVHLDDSLSPCPGLKSVDYRTFEPSFLAGVAAMAISKTKKAAAIAGMDLRTVDEFIRGFTAGVMHSNGQVTAIEYLAEDETGFSDPEGAGEVARKLYSTVDVILPVSGGSDLGVFEAAKEGGNRYTLSSDVSYELGKSVIVGSVIKRLDFTVLDTIKQFACGDFSSGTVESGLANGGTEFVVNPVFQNFVSAAVEKARNAAEKSALEDAAAH